ncbi:MAG: hypothetical protein GX447_08150 [Elusimicrobia bacterium]|nr:hypothetical protein [Elusimicrobiota bacterium]
MNIKQVYFPKTLKEALSLTKKKNSVFIAGSSYSFKNIPSQAEIAVMGSNLPLTYIKKDSKNLILGAGATFADMEENKICKTLFGGVLAKAASACSSQLIRNMATVGGNLAHPNAFNLMPLLCSCMDAKVKIMSSSGTKTVLWKEIYGGKYKAGKDFLITEILFPLSYSKNIFYFEKVSKIKSSWDSYITVCFSLELKKSAVKNISLAFSALRAIPIRALEAEKKLIGKTLDSQTISEAADLCAQEILSVHKGSSWEYKAKLAGNLTSYFLSTAAEAK